MTVSLNLGFLWKSEDIEGNVLVPRYYDPELRRVISRLRPTHELVRFGELIDTGEVQVDTGDEIGKMAYGTGEIPFVRTSDIGNWELRADPKQAVSEAIYDQYSKDQDVRAGDIFFVRDGTYLVGNACILTRCDRKLLYQSHILKFRVAPDARLTPEFLLALLSSPLVRRQIFTKRLTADIIDTLGNRYRELILPIPKDRDLVRTVSTRVGSIVESRSRFREILRDLPSHIESRGGTSRYSANEEAPSGIPLRLGFLVKTPELHGNVLVPRAYDPSIRHRLDALRSTHDLVTIGSLVLDSKLELVTGIEVGKMAYGTGPIPFIRTSDITNWELSIDPKQTISEDLCKINDFPVDTRPGDILLVRDGTYLIGTSCVITDSDPMIVFASGLYRIRAIGPNAVDPYLLWVLLNCQLVQRQFRAVQFTRDVIDTIGRRILDVILPIPKSPKVRESIVESARKSVETRARLRNESVTLANSLAGSASQP